MSPASTTTTSVVAVSSAVHSPPERAAVDDVGDHLESEVLQRRGIGGDQPGDHAERREHRPLAVDDRQRRPRRAAAWRARPDGAPGLPRGSPPTTSTCCAVRYQNDDPRGPHRRRHRPAPGRQPASRHRRRDADAAGVLRTLARADGSARQPRRPGAARRRAQLPAAGGAGGLRRRHDARRPVVGRMAPSRRSASRCAWPGRCRAAGAAATRWAARGGWCGRPSIRRTPRCRRGGGTPGSTSSGSVFCTLRDPWPWPTCTYFSAAIQRHVELCGAPAPGGRSPACRATGAAACRLDVEFTAARPPEPARMIGARSAPAADRGGRAPAAGRRPRARRRRPPRAGHAGRAVRAGEVRCARRLAGGRHGHRRDRGAGRTGRRGGRARRTPRGLRSTAAAAGRRPHPRHHHQGGRAGRGDARRPRTGQRERDRRRDRRAGPARGHRPAGPAAAAPDRGRRPAADLSRRGPRRRGLRHRGGRDARGSRRRCRRSSSTCGASPRRARTCRSATWSRRSTPHRATWRRGWRCGWCRRSVARTSRPSRR